MILCDVVGFTLEDAIEKLKDCGINPKIVETSSLKSTVAEDGIARVVRQIEEDGSQTIIVCKIPDNYR
ncbi:MAG: PASTA domain-containing protein [Clostridia bacterium]|nr:PASTA domain-containing protein [Clostridia bacterium]